jgi:hypothetical protein
MRHLLLASALVAPSAAHAFCGTFVGSGEDELTSGQSRVVLARNGKDTFLTLENDVHGALADFAMVLPVPEVLTAEDAAVLNVDVVDKLAAYSVPRLVSYTCEDFQPDDIYDYGNCDFDLLADGGDAGASEDEDVDPPAVTVEELFAVGEYDVVVLSATESAGLLDWLTAEGFAVSPQAKTALQSYIDQGTYFLAAKVALDRVTGDTLSPLRLHYESDVFGLPVLLGTVNSPGVQDLVVYTLTTLEGGATAISNYDQGEVEDECLWRANGQSFSEFWDAQVTRATDGGRRAQWIREYGWPLVFSWPGSMHCDPCTGDPPVPDELVGFGWSGPDVYVTRLHLRYGPGQVDQDLMLYESGTSEQEQIRYIEYEEYLEDRFPICGEGWATDPGACEIREPRVVDACPDDHPNGGFGALGCRGCDSSRGGAGMLGVFALLAVRRRR